MRSLYCTADKIGTETGGGVVTKNELEALRSVSDDVFVLSYDQLNPAGFHQPDSVFLFDYLALQQIKNKHFDLAHFYSSTFTQTVSWLKSKGTQVTYTVPFHDRKTTVEEFHRLGLEYPFPHIKDDDLWSIFSEGYRLADKVIAPSKRSAQLLRDEGCQDVVVIPHGVNIPNEVKPIPNEFKVGYLGAYGPDKGVLYLLQGWATLNYPDAELVLAGPGSGSLEPFVRQVANQGRFALLGYVNDVTDFYNQISVYCQPSVCESFGIEILEAIARGRPVIASEGAGASELIEDGVEGFVVPIRDPQAIAEKIDWFRKNSEKMVEMVLALFSRNARKKAENYTWDKIRKRYIEIWRILTSEKVQ